MMKNIYLFLIASLLYFPLSVSAQSTAVNIWKTLGKVQFIKKMDEDLGYAIKFPKYPAEIEELDGKEVIIRGYIIPLQEEMGYFVLSALPFESCFFCGQAGIETVMEVYTKEEIDYKPTAIRLRGKLTINHDNTLDQLLYVLKDAELVKD